jgi:hypothetical protein
MSRYAVVLGRRLALVCLSQWCGEDCTSIICGGGVGTARGGATTDQCRSRNSPVWTVDFVV